MICTVLEEILLENNSLKLYILKKSYFRAEGKQSAPYFKEVLAPRRRQTICAFRVDWGIVIPERKGHLKGSTATNLGFESLGFESLGFEMSEKIRFN